MNTFVMDKSAKLAVNGLNAPTHISPVASKIAEKWKRMPTITPSKCDGWIY